MQEHFLEQEKQHTREVQYMSVAVSAEAQQEQMVLPDLKTIAPLKLVALDLDGTTLRDIVDRNQYRILFPA